MTGEFTRVIRTTSCVFAGCVSVMQAGATVYLWHGLENHPVCPDCAKTRWGYQATDTPKVSTAAVRESLSFDSTKTILKALQQKANAGDPKLKQLGGDR